jgi:Trypsin-like peptidase domain/Gram-negative bacterial TonB protein C-terminal
MTTHRDIRATAAVVLACFIWLTASPCAHTVNQAQISNPKLASASDEATLVPALCPIVYQADRSPSPRGYRYLFYGNGFFVNQAGYVITAAHVLSQLHGGQPYLLLRTSTGNPAFVQAAVVAVDVDHDVALLRASPNPFEGDYIVSFLPFATESPQVGRKVIAAALRPANPRDSYSLEPIVQERPLGAVLGFPFSQLEKGRADTELFVFNHSIEPGQSGAPVMSADSEGVVGLVEGEWLRNTSALTAPAKESAGALNSTASDQTVSVPGAVIPIHYAIALLQKKQIIWQATSAQSSTERTPAGADSLPAPLSLVPAPYPPQALFGGELLLDALVSSSGNVSSVRVVHGVEPFLQKGLAAVRTWTFVPARIGGHAIECHVAIVFVFPQPYFRPRSSTIHHYDEAASAAARDRAALLLTTVEPESPFGTNTEGSVILYGTVSTDGELASIKTLRDHQPFTQATVSAVHDWHFLPGKRAGADAESLAVVVSTFRQPLVASRGNE